MSTHDARLDVVLDRYVEDAARLGALEAEYAVTLKVLAVLTERLLAATGGRRVEIADSALADPPDLRAWRDDAGQQVVIHVGR